MINTNRLDSIVFDLKESIEDFSNELKLVIDELNEVNQKLDEVKRKNHDNNLTFNTQSSGERF